MLPEVKYYDPGRDLEWLVIQYQNIRYNSNDFIIDKFIPRPDVSIVFHFRKLPQLIKPVNQQLPRFFIAPLSPRANLISIQKDLDTFIATCKATVLSRILDISNKTGREIFITLPEKLFLPLWENMLNQTSTEERIGSFSSFISSLIPGQYIPDETDMYYDTIISEGIRTPLQDIIKSFPVSERTVQRKFTDRVGVSPKTLIRLVRINYLWEKVNNETPLDQHDLVFLGHYFDQNHFIKDFKAITGETPDCFFKRNNFAAKVFSGHKTIINR